MQCLLLDGDAQVPAATRLSVLRRYSDAARSVGVPLLVKAMEAAAKTYALMTRSTAQLHRSVQF
jgi:aminoglycoside/choline kinase family phosphotransferase